MLATVALFVLAAVLGAKPPQAPRPPQTTLPARNCDIPACKCGCADGETCTCSAAKKPCTNCPCGVDGCPCGCCDGKACGCYKHRKEGTRDGKRIWTNEDGGYWYEWLQPAPTYNHSFPPEAYAQWAQRAVPMAPMMQSFGGGGMRGCAGGG